MSDMQVQLRCALQVVNLWLACVPRVEPPVVPRRIALTMMWPMQVAKVAMPSQVLLVLTVLQAAAVVQLVYLPTAATAAMVLLVHQALQVQLVQAIPILAMAVWV